MLIFKCYSYLCVFLVDAWLDWCQVWEARGNDLAKQATDSEGRASQTAAAYPWTYWRAPQRTQQYYHRYHFNTGHQVCLCVSSFSTHQRLQHLACLCVVCRFYVELCSSLGVGGLGGNMLEICGTTNVHSSCSCLSCCWSLTPAVKKTVAIIYTELWSVKNHTYDLCLLKLDF